MVERLAGGVLLADRLLAAGHGEDRRRRSPDLQPRLDVAVDRLGRLGRLGLVRAFERADRLALALRARCFSWEPTPPRFRFTAADAVVSLLGGGLAVAGLAVLLGL